MHSMSIPTLSGAVIPFTFIVAIFTMFLPCELIVVFRTPSSPDAERKLLAEFFPFNTLPLLFSQRILSDKNIS